MQARPSFDTIPPTEVEGAQLLDRSLRRARALEVLAGSPPSLSWLSLLLLALGSAGAVYGLSMQHFGQLLLAWFATFGAYLAVQLYAQVRDLRARVDALQELLRQAETGER